MWRQEKEVNCACFKLIFRKFDIKPSRHVLNVLNLMWKWSIFNDWNGEQFVFNCQIVKYIESAMKVLLKAGRRW